MDAVRVIEVNEVYNSYASGRITLYEMVSPRVWEPPRPLGSYLQYD